MVKFLIIQTAFIGDVVLATPIIEKLHKFYPDSQSDFLLRKGNEGLLKNQKYLNIVIGIRSVNMNLLNKCIEVHRLSNEIHLILEKEILK